MNSTEVRTPPHSRYALRSLAHSFVPRAVGVGELRCGGRGRPQLPTPSGGDDDAPYSTRLQFYLSTPNNVVDDIEQGRVDCPCLWADASDVQGHVAQLYVAYRMHGGYSTRRSLLAIDVLSTFYAHSLAHLRSYYRVEGARRKCTDSSNQGQASVRGRWALWIDARRLFWERVKAGVHAAVQAAAHPVSDVGSLESEQSGVGSPRSRATCGRQCRVTWFGFRVPRRRGVLAETAVFQCPAKRVVDFRLDFGFNVGFSRPRRSGEAKLPAGVPGGRPAATSR